MSLISRILDLKLRERIPYFRIGSSADRRFRRLDCYIISTMSMMNRPIMFDGVVDSISAKGMQFRPATSYLMDHRGEMVGIDINSRSYYGTIVATRQSGYGVALTDPIPDDEMDAIQLEHGYAQV